MITGVLVGNDEHILYRVPVGMGETDYESADALAQLFERTYRRSSSPGTIWLEVKGPVVPSYVIKALEQKAPLPIAVVLTCDGDCSHGPVGRMPIKIQRAVAGIGQDCRVWHPIQEKFVSALYNSET